MACLAYARHVPGGYWVVARQAPGDRQVPDWHKPGNSGQNARNPEYFALLDRLQPYEPTSSLYIRFRVPSGHSRVRHFDNRPRLRAEKKITGTLDFHQAGFYIEPSKAIV
jgi:hypothetical protein